MINNQINTKHKLYARNSQYWQKVRDACEGEDAVKAKKTRYLPKPSQMEQETYDNYLARAKYVNYAGKTLNNAVSQIFRTEPIIDDFSDILKEDIDLTGKSLQAFSRSVINELLQTNRVGILVDYSEDLMRPYLTMFKAEQIINWRIENNRPVLIVIEGTKEVEDLANKYNTISVKVWKELYIEDGIYKSRDWEESYDAHNKSNITMVSEYTPIINDNYFDYIPFFCITTLGDSLEYVKSPLLDLVNLNLGAYINSADYENMLHWCSARTIITNGLGQTEFHVGGVVDFNVGGGAKYLETTSDALILEELRHKEEQMAVLGSSLLSGKGRYVASAETARISSEGEYASLSDIAVATSEVMTYIIRVMMLWFTGVESQSTVEYNTIYEKSKMSADEIRTYVDAVIKGVMSFDVFYRIMEAREVYPETWTLEMEKASLSKTTEDII